MCNKFKNKLSALIGEAKIELHNILLAKKVGATTSIDISQLGLTEYFDGQRLQINKVGLGLGCSMYILVGERNYGYTLEALPDNKIIELVDYILEQAQ